MRGSAHSEHECHTRTDRELLRTPEVWIRASDAARVCDDARSQSYAVRPEQHRKWTGDARDWTFLCWHFQSQLRMKMFCYEYKRMISRGRGKADTIKRRSLAQI